MYNGSWLKIEDLQRFLIQFEPKLIHPDDPRWITFWREMKKRCIEGVWFEDFGKWRYGRGNLGFYHWYTRIPDIDEENKTHGKLIRPLIRDLEWHYSYYMCEARGFSGFSDDDKYTSDLSIFNIDKSKFAISDPKYLRYFKPNGQFKEFIAPRENLFRLHDKPVGRPLYYNDAKNFMVLGSRGGGKAAPLYTKIPSPGGYTTMGELKPGSVVFNRNGDLTKVIAIHPQGDKQIYKVRFKDGRESECCEDHLWVVRVGNTEKVMSVKDMLVKGLKYEGKRGGVWKFRVPVCKPVRYDEKDLPVDPYILGALLGDGTLSTATPKIAIGDKEILDYFRKKLVGFQIEFDKTTNNNYTIVDREKEEIYVDTSSNPHFKSKGYYTVKGNRLTNCLRELGLNVTCKEKFIPVVYLQASIEQRFELLRGLMDTDGSCTTSGSSEFTSTNEKLALQVMQLARSLGIVSQLGIDDRSDVLHDIKGHVCYKPKAYRVYMNTTKPIFKIKSKSERLKNKSVTNQQSYIPIVSIEATGKYTEMQCITVADKTSTYLTDDYIVTHNTLYSGLAEVKYDLVFDGAKVYNEETRLKPTAIKINVGAGMKSKSAKLLKEIEISMNNLAVDPECGTWGKPEDEANGGVYEPCPFYKRMSGSFKTDDPRGWTNEFEVKVGNQWETRGTKSTIYHLSYSANKKTGAEAGAGGRRSLIVYEEIGLFEDMLNAWGSDEAVVRIDGVQFAPRIGIGTSGNIETIKAAQKVFTHPKEYNCLEFPSEDGESTQCFFLPAYIVDKRFKDSNGNTNLEKAIKYYDDELAEKLKTNDSTIINNYKMNYPTKVDHMWVSATGDLLPVKEAELREKQLLRNNLYEALGKPIELFWNPDKPEGVDYKINPALQPFYDDNFDDRDNLDGAVVMYEQPFRINGIIPHDAHIITHDPYISDAWDEGGSLGATHVWINPKYIPYGAKGNCLAATYIGKHRKGVDGYNEVLEKLCAFYGNPFRGLWYESNRGDRLRSYFLKKNKANLLCLQPQFEQGQHIYLRNTNKTGFVVGSSIAKISMIDRLNEWLLEETQLDSEEEPMQNIFRIPCLFSIRQIKAYDLKGNYDLVSSMLGLPLALGEIQHRIKENMNPQKNPLGIMTKYIKQRLGA